MSKNPADGERSAASGYRAQYHVGASIVFNALEKGDLEWVKVADPEIGRVDDLQTATTARVDAYQVKWGQYPGAITFNDLIKAQKSAPPLFKQLADGWCRLKKQYPLRRVVVHLTTNQYASSSTSGTMPDCISEPTPYHFAAFVEQAWKPAKRKAVPEFSGEWEPVWSEIRITTQLSSNEFAEFVQDCSLDFRQLSPDNTKEIAAIADLLFKTAADSERLIELKRNELIQLLGWENRYSTWNIHEFPEPKYTYLPIQETVENLKSAIGELNGGYIGVFGSPGSGKSTLLTQTLRTLPVRLIRYYAYVPDSQSSSAIRGESRSFLHDITLKLAQAGFRTTIATDPSDRIGMQKTLNEQINSLGVEFQKTGDKTVLLIDGLDHIAREQHPNRSLLCDLPLPQEIPDGVYIILGSQTDQLSDLPSQVMRALKMQNRRIEMGRFSFSDTRAIVSKAIPELGEEEHQRIFEIGFGAKINPVAFLRLSPEQAHGVLRLRKNVSHLKSIEPCGATSPHRSKLRGILQANKVDKKGEERVFLVYDKQEKNTLSPKRIIPCSELGCI